MISMSIMFATFARVFLLGFQSRCVNAGSWGTAWCVSWMIAGVEALALFAAIKSGDLLVIFLSSGLGASFGIVAAIFAYQALRVRRD